MRAEIISGDYFFHNLLREMMKRVLKNCQSMIKSFNPRFSLQGQNIVNESEDNS